MFFRFLLHNLLVLKMAPITTDEESQIEILINEERLNAPKNIPNDADVAEHRNVATLIRNRLADRLMQYHV